MQNWYEEMHKENTRVFLALVYSFLGVRAEETHGEVFTGVRLGRELRPEEVTLLPEEIQEILHVHDGKVRCHFVEV